MYFPSFSLSISLDSREGIYIVVMTLLQFGMNSILSEESDFNMINNFLMSVHIFSQHMLTSFSVDEILLSKINDD